MQTTAPMAGSSGRCWRRRCCRWRSRCISPPSSAYRDHYALLFGWIFLIDAALLAIAIARRYEVLHAFSAVTTVLAVVIWISTAYLPGAVLPVIGFVALFVVFYLAAPAIAARFGEPFEGLGEHAVLASPLLLAAFPLLVIREPRAESPVVLFPALFALVLLIVWRSFTEPTGRLYFIAAFFALATEAAWSSQLPDAGHAARRRSSPMPRSRCCISAFRRLRGGAARRCSRRPGPGIVLLLGLLLLSYFADAGWPRPDCGDSRCCSRF